MKVRILMEYGDSGVAELKGNQAMHQTDACRICVFQGRLCQPSQRIFRCDRHPKSEYAWIKVEV